MLKVKRNNCTGCGMCAALCPQKAIDMKKDKEGFLYPFVNKNKCVNCNLCNNKCPSCCSDFNEKSMICYAVQAKNKEILKHCASGGAFTILAQYVIENNGIVGGVIQKDNKDLEYILVDNEKQLKKLQGSKYYQCNINPKIYSNIKNELKNRKVLFSGTPCQVAAINNFIPKGLKNNLITVEIICQGVHSDKVVKYFYKQLEKEENSKIVLHEFRNKDKYVGRDYLNKYVFSNGKIKYLIGSEDLLCRAFKSQVFLRKVCYKCKFAKNERVADFTVGDLWKYKGENKGIDEKKGISIIVLNTEKAKKIFESCTNCNKQKMPITCLDSNIPFNHPVKKQFARRFSYKLLNKNINVKILTKVCCWKYYVKNLIKKR